MKCIILLSTTFEFDTNSCELGAAKKKTNEINIGHEMNVFHATLICRINHQICVFKTDGLNGSIYDRVAHRSL